MSTTVQTRKVTMKAIVYRQYGPPDAVLELRDVEKPVVGDEEVLVRVHAASVNPVDWHTMTGWPYLVRAQAGLRRPKSEQLGVDYAGTVEEVGSAVTEFRPGDEVFGARNGALAEYVRARADRAIVAKPPTVTFAEAAAVPIAGLTALQGVRDKGKVEAGQKVLINGASGGVGTYAVQIAKAFGADVTGVCSTPNVETVRSIGADHVVDYTREDFTRRDERYDVMIDVAGGRSWSDCKRVLTPDATVVQIGGPKRNRFVGLSVSSLLATRVATMFGSRNVTMFLAKTNKPDLATLRDLMEAGKVTSVVDRHYSLADTPEALAYLGEGHARGKIVIDVLEQPA